MIFYSKFMLSLLVTGLFVSCNKNTTVYEDEYVSFSLPEGTQTENLESQYFSGKSFFMEGEYALNLYELPIGLTANTLSTFLPSFRFPWLTGAEISEDTINGYPVTAFSQVMHGNYNLYTNTYVFSNSEKTVILTESSKDAPTNWWKENIKWNIPQKSNLSLRERLHQLAMFISDMNPKADNKLEIIANEDNKTVELKVITAIESYDKAEQTQSRVKSEFQFLSGFDVIEEYKGRQYDFVFTIYDKSGNKLDQIIIPYTEYFQW